MRHFRGMHDSFQTRVWPLFTDLVMFSMAQQPPPSTETPQHSARMLATEIVFVDSAATNPDDALQSILATSSSTGIQVVYLDTESNGIELISRALSDQTGFKTAHIVSNGYAGQLQLGNVYLCNANIGSYAGRIAAWQMALSTDAQIRIHGANLESQAGEGLVEDLGLLTSARVTTQPNE